MLVAKILQMEIKRQLVLLYSVKSFFWAENRLGMPRSGVSFGPGRIDFDPSSLLFA